MKNYFQEKNVLRDRPFNLQGGLWFLVSFRIIFSDNTRVTILIFFVAQSTIFFPEFNIRLYDKNSESDYYFFPPPKSEYFFQQHWESDFFFRKKTKPPPPPPPFKLNGRSLNHSDILQRKRLKIFTLPNTNLSIVFSAKHAALRRKGKDGLTRNQDNVPEWSDMSNRGH